MTKKTKSIRGARTAWITVAIIAVPAALQTWDWITAARANPVAVVSYHSFSVPLSVQSELDKLSDRLAADNLPLLRHVNNVSDKLQRISVVWEATIKNKGDKKSESVILKLPNAVLAEIRREGKRKTTTSKGELIELGTL